MKRRRYWGNICNNLSAFRSGTPVSKIRDTHSPYSRPDSNSSSEYLVTGTVNSFRLAFIGVTLTGIIARITAFKIESEVSSRMKGKYTKLFLIGNGFDRWQGLPTSYDNFRQYYFNHILEITKQLRVKTEKDKAGNVITPVEKIYGDIFNPAELPGEFFWNFESSMALLDDQNIALGYLVTGTVKETLQYYENITHDFRCDSLTLTPCTC